MERFKRFLAEGLESRIPQELLPRLPSGCQRVGDIIIVNINPELGPFEKEIGGLVLEGFTGVRTVCARDGPVKGEKREPSVRAIAGDGTETVHREGGCLFRLDVTRVMLSKGNSKERHRLASAVGREETVVDMFAGIGYFSIPIAKLSKPRKIVSIDINPESINYLKQNIMLNKVGCIEPVLGDCREVSKSMPGIADRVVMGYLPGTDRYLPYAFGLLKPRGIIHFHDVFPEKDLWKAPEGILRKSAEENGYTLKKILYEGRVKMFGPRRYHVVIDALFEKVSGKFRASGKQRDGISPGT